MQELSERERKELQPHVEKLLREALSRWEDRNGHLYSKVQLSAIRKSVEPKLRETIERALLTGVTLPDGMRVRYGRYGS
jgi:hypothetical protein